MALPESAFVEVFDRVPVALIVRSLETEQFLAVNRAFESLSGYGRDELIGKTPTTLGIFDPIPHHHANVERVLMDGAIHGRRGALRTKNGRVVEVEFSSVRMIVAGELCAVSVVVEDEDARRGG